MSEIEQNQNGSRPSELPPAGEREPSPQDRLRSLFVASIRNEIDLFYLERGVTRARDSFISRGNLDRQKWMNDHPGERYEDADRLGEAENQRQEHLAGTALDLGLQMQEISEHQQDILRAQKDLVVKLTEAGGDAKHIDNLRNEAKALVSNELLEQHREVVKTRFELKYKYRTTEDEEEKRSIIYQSNANTNRERDIYDAGRKILGIGRQDLDPITDQVRDEVRQDFLARYAVKLEQENAFRELSQRSPDHSVKRAYNRHCWEAHNARLRIKEMLNQELETSTEAIDAYVENSRQAPAAPVAA